MKMITCGQALLALCLAVAAWPVTADPNPNRPPPMHVNTPMPPALFARLLQAEADKKDGEAAFRAKDYATAEAYFRAAIDGCHFGEAYRGLAESLAAQGKTDEALQTYRTLIVRDENHAEGANPDTRALLGYAVLLNQSGQWSDAVAAYQSALSSPVGGTLPKYYASFDSRIPQPAALAAAAHIALGMDANWRCNNIGEYEHDRAFQEYSKALQFAPDSDVANYYYGYGWQRLDAKDRAKLAANPGQREAVKAALEKAAKTGTGDIQKAAAAELQHLQ